MKILGKLFYAVFILILLSVAGLFLATLVPIPGNIEVKIVKSGSMEPNIPTGSLVVIKPQADYRLGDIITFGADTKMHVPTTHRIVDIFQENGGTSYQTKGDANEDVDPSHADKKEVIGRVMLHVAYAGYVLDFARQPLGFALLIGIPATLVILEEIFAIGREIMAIFRRKRNGKDDTHNPGISGREMPEQITYGKRRAMDDIYVPMSMVVAGAKQSNEKRRHDRYAAASLLVVCLVLTSIKIVDETGATLAYFSDSENSNNNAFDAGHLGFSVQANAESAEIREGGSATFAAVFTPVSGSLALKYKIRAQKGGGVDDFCNALDASFSEPVAYSGAILGINVGPTDSIDALLMQISLPSGSGLGDGDQCIVDLIYSGWQGNLNENEGYTDISTTTLTFTYIAPEPVAPAQTQSLRVSGDAEENASEESTNEGTTTPETVDPIEEPKIKPKDEPKPEVEEESETPPETGTPPETSSGTSTPESP